MRLIRCACLLALVIVGAAPRYAAADGSWLDGDRASWNYAGMPIPAAPEATPPFGPCGDFIRPPETSEDELLAAAGWRLDGGYESGWGIRVVHAAQSFDANCRPMDYQGFIFVDGVFAGTISPQPMISRTDGAATDFHIWRANQVSATYTRYGPNDPLCCPASMAYVNFDIQRTADGPFAIPRPAS
jgi:LppP/LprE lipoprotein